MNTEEFKEEASILADSYNALANLVKKDPLNVSKRPKMFRLSVMYIIGHSEKPHFWDRFEKMPKHDKEFLLNVVERVYPQRHEKVGELLRLINPYLI